MADPIVEETLVEQPPYRLPGAPVASQADVEALAERQEEAAALPQPAALDVPEYDGVVTTDPKANLASRSNIVADGPGTVGDEFPAVTG